MARESWSVLPIELLNLVLNLVDIADIVRLTVVCKTWQQPALDGLRRRHKNLPWIVSFNHGKSRKLGLCDPWLKKSYSLEKIIRRNGVKKLLRDTSTVHASQHGWLLLSKQEVKSDGSNIISFMFYNPFRNEIIELPPLDLNTDKHESKAMCSSTPTSPDCVIFVMSKVTRGGKVIYMLSTCKSKKWTSIETTNGWGRQWYVEDMVHMNGKFCCIFGQYSDRMPYVKLGIFNVALEEWSIEQYNLEFTVCSRSLIEFDGELFLVNRYRIVLEIWQFDRSEKTLTRTKSLGDRVLFLNQRPFPALSMAAVGATKEEFANMIVLLGLSGHETYTCKDDRGHWTHHQTHDWYEGFRSSESTFWIDGPNF